MTQQQQLQDLRTKLAQLRKQTRETEDELITLTKRFRYGKQY